MPLKKQALYPKEEIDKLATERDKLLEIEQEPERLKFMLATSKELEQVVEIDQMIYPQETWMTIEELQERQIYNPKITHVLKDEKIGDILGYISMSPMKSDTLKKLTTLEIDETSIKPDNYLPYTTDAPQDCYIISIGARPSAAGHYYAGKMLQSCANYLLELLEQGIILQRLYTVVTTEDGVRIAHHLSFKPLATETEWKSKYENFRRPYILDLEDKESKSAFAKEYQRHLVNRSRRKKRYIKESSKKA